MTPNTNQYLFLVKTILQKEGSLCPLSDPRTLPDVTNHHCVYICTDT